jgi:hypothetical protein
MAHPQRSWRVEKTPALPSYPPYLRIIRFQGRQLRQIEKKTLSAAEAGVRTFERVTAKQILQLLEY